MKPPSGGPITGPIRAGIVTHAIDIITLPIVEALALVKWLIYQIQKAIWEIYDNLRFQIVLGGLLFPEPRDLTKMPWGNCLLNTAHVHLTGGPAANFNIYPRKQVQPHNEFGPVHLHLQYPGTALEQFAGEPAPIPFHGVFPETFITQGFPFVPAVVPLHDAKGPYAGVGMPPFTHDIDSATWATGQFGSALGFSARLIAERLEKGIIPNFNLDGDRGYAWKTWRADDPKNIETNNPVHTKYIDP
jgi:hypothetical protein